MHRRKNVPQHGSERGDVVAPAAKLNQVLSSIDPQKQKRPGLLLRKVRRSKRMKLPLKPRLIVVAGRVLNQFGQNRRLSTLTVAIVECERDTLSRYGKRPLHSRV